MHRNTFSLTPEYLAHETRGLAAGHLWFNDYGLQLSRQFRALKVWMSVKEHGLDRFGQMIARNVQQAHYLGELIESDPTLELMAPIGMDIVCFRFDPGGLDDEQLNALNKEILMQLHEQGIAAPSYYDAAGSLLCAGCDFKPSQPAGRLRAARQGGRADRARAGRTVSINNMSS
jgi:glutamate/tyrosine decarboxylase-like PLP-dependent enzyme